MTKGLGYDYYPEVGRGKTYMGNGETVRIKPFYWGIGFHLTSRTQDYLRLEDMIPVVTIHEFLLNGQTLD